MPHHPHHLKEKKLTGNRLRAYAFALLAHREYSKQELYQKLNLYAIDSNEVQLLVDELANSLYQSDQRVAQTILSSNLRKGKGIYRIQQNLQKKGLDSELIKQDLQHIDWLKQAYQLKVKKFGTAIAQDPKLKAKQIRFLQYRGFTMDIILKAIQQHPNDYDDE